LPSAEAVKEASKESVDLAVQAKAEVIAASNKAATAVTDGSLLSKEMYLETREKDISERQL